MKNTIKNFWRNQFFNFSIFVGYDYISLGHSVSQCSLWIPNFEYILVTKRTPKNLFLGKTPKIDRNCQKTFSNKKSGEKSLTHLAFNLHIWFFWPTYYYVCQSYENVSCFYFLLTQFQLIRKINMRQTAGDGKTATNNLSSIL